MVAPELFLTVSAWSRQHCGAICTFLVPANLSATLATAILLCRPKLSARLPLAALLASSFAIILALHVATWLVIQVVTPITFILFSLGGTCLAINLAAVWLHQYQPGRAPQLARWAAGAVNQRWSNQP